jgi:hypothetical protein
MGAATKAAKAEDIAGAGDASAANELVEDMVVRKQEAAFIGSMPNTLW